MTDAADSANVQLGADVAAPAALSLADVGAWQVLPFHSEVLAVHAALLPRRVLKSQAARGRFWQGWRVFRISGHAGL